MARGEIVSSKGADSLSRRKGNWQWGEAVREEWGELRGALVGPVPKSEELWPDLSRGLRLPPGPRGPPSWLPVSAA